MRKLIYIMTVISLLISSLTVNAAPKYGAELSNMPTRVYSQKFTDVDEDHWAFTYISELTEKGIISGYPDGKFRPDNTISRSEFAKVMVTASGIKVNPIEYTTFSDITIDDWCAPYVESAKPYLNGYIINNKSMYFPNSMALREDIAVALVKLKGYNTSVADISLLYAMFTDAESISTSAQKYVAVAIERGLVSGYSDETFRGQQTITRAEAAALIWRASQFGNDNKVIETSSKPIKTQTQKQPIKVDTESTTTKSPIASKEYSIDTIVEDVENVLSITIDKNDTIYYLTPNSILGTNGYELDLTDMAFCPKLEEDKRHICKIKPKAITYDKDKLLLIANVCNSTYLFDITDEDPILELELDSSSYSNKLEFLKNGYILNGSRLFNTKGKCILELNGDSIYYNNKFYWFDMDAFDVDTELLSEDINGKITKVNSKAKFSYYQTQAFESYNNKLYVMTDDGFYEYDTEGYEEKIFSLEDIEILDFKSTHIKINSFIIDNENNIIFYDKNSASIRKIKENNYEY